MADSKDHNILDGSTASSENVANDTQKQADTAVHPDATEEDEVNYRENAEARSAFLATFSAEESKTIMKKVDRRFFVLIGVMFMVKNICYSNASTIRVLQVGEPSNIMNELRMSQNDYNWVSSIYGIPYMIFELPSNMVLKYFKPHNWQARIFCLWGICTIGCGFVQTKGQLLALRFLIGMFEAGMFPGVVTTLAYWYRTDEFNRPMVWYFAISNLAGIVGSLLAYGVSYMNGVRDMSAWRWVFIIEGIGTILLSIVIWFVLPDFPKSSRTHSWLNKRERDFVEARLPLNAPSTEEKNFTSKEAWDSFRSPLVWGFLCAQTFMNLAYYGFNWYLPTVITNFGFVGLPKNQLLNIPPVGAGVLGIIFSSWFTSKAYVLRPAYVTFLVVGTVVGNIILTAGNPAARYAACIVAALFAGSFYPPYWGWRAGYLTGSTGAAFAMGLQSSIAQLGAVVGPHFFNARYARSNYRESFGICLSMIVGGLLSVLYSWRLTRNVEKQVLRVRREAIRARKEGREYDGHDDIDILNDETIKNRKWW